MIWTLILVGWVAANCRDKQWVSNDTLDATCHGAWLNVAHPQEKFMANHANRKLVMKHHVELCNKVVDRIEVEQEGYWMAGRQFISHPHECREGWHCGIRAQWVNNYWHPSYYMARQPDPYGAEYRNVTRLGLRLRRLEPYGIEVVREFSGARREALWFNEIYHRVVGIKTCTRKYGHLKETEREPLDMAFSLRVSWDIPDGIFGSIEV